LDYVNILKSIIADGIIKWQEKGILKFIEYQELVLKIATNNININTTLDNLEKYLKNDKQVFLFYQSKYLLDTN